jgi:membrane fusion protein (multidrug efflux system)
MSPEIQNRDPRGHPTHEGSAERAARQEPEWTPNYRGESESYGPPDDLEDGISSPTRSPSVSNNNNGARRAFFYRHLIQVLIALIALLAAAAGGYLYWDYARHFETTDDAFIDSRQFSVAPKVSGYITAVSVTDNEHVVAGDVIARIDDRDYRIAIAQAVAQVRSAKASILNIDAQTAAQQAQVDEAVAQDKQAEAALQFAQAEARRYQDLAKTGAGTIRRAEQATSQLKQSQADVARTKAAVAASERQIAALRTQRVGAEASLEQGEAQVDLAKLNLEYTTVTAAQAGRIVRLTAAVGQYAQSGQSLSMFVPDAIWVTANYKETQLKLMRPAQAVEISIDAYPGRTVNGHIESVQPGSGTAFSLLPAENATGNYVKVAQRVPVKIAMENPPKDVALGPGMSVVPTTRVRPEPSLYERITGR